MEDKRKTIIHIGYPKTGSTWLQKRLFPRVENIDFISHKNIPESIYSDDLKEDEITQMRKYFQNNKKDVLLSDEGLIGGNKTMLRNAKRLKEIFGEAEIIIFIRNQIDKYASNYSQHIKAGCTCSIDKFLFPYGFDKEPYGGRKHSYDKLFDIYKDIFGKEHVHGYLFEDFINDPQEFVKEFTEKFNMDVDLKRIKYQPENKRLSLSGIKMKRFSNYFTRRCAYNTKKRSYLKNYYFHLPFWYEISFYITNILQRVGIFCSKSSYYDILGENNITRLTRYFKASNNRLIENHGFKMLAKFNYPL